MTTAILTTTDLFSKINNMGLPEQDLVHKDADLLTQRALQVNPTLKAFYNSLDADSEPDTVGLTAGLLHLFRLLAQYDCTKINNDQPQGPSLELLSDFDENIDEVFQESAVDLPIVEALKTADPTDPLAIEGTVWAGPFERGVAVAYATVHAWVVTGLGPAGSFARPHDYDVPESLGSPFSGIAQEDDPELQELLDSVQVPVTDAEDTVETPRTTQTAGTSDRVLELLHQITQLTASLPGVGSRLDKNPEGSWVVDVIVPNKSSDAAFTYFGTDVVDAINVVAAATGMKPHVYYENDTLLLSTTIK